MMEELKPCPCGKTPTKLHIAGYEREKWQQVYGDCCEEWMIEFRSGYEMNDSPKLMQYATEAWNDAPRNTTKDSK